MIRGVRQLKELVIRYSDLDGSSKGNTWYIVTLLPYYDNFDKIIISLHYFLFYLYFVGVREWMRNDLITLAKNNDAVLFKAEKKRCAHPFLRGIYANGNSKTICIKNLSKEEIHSYALDLRNQVGRKVSTIGYKKPVISENPSIQGLWDAQLDLYSIPKFNIKDIY